MKTSKRCPPCSSSYGAGIAELGYSKQGHARTGESDHHEKFAHDADHQRHAGICERGHIVAHPLQSMNPSSACWGQPGHRIVQCTLSLGLSCPHSCCLQAVLCQSSTVEEAPHLVRVVKEAQLVMQFEEGAVGKVTAHQCVGQPPGARRIRFSTEPRCFHGPILQQEAVSSLLLSEKACN